MTLLEVVEAVAPPIMGDRHVHAMWLEGSYATGNANERSDIDVWLDVDDGSFAHCVHAFRSALASIQQIRAEDPRGIYSEEPRLAKHCFYLNGFSDDQRIELDLQEHSRRYVFSETDHVLKILFDKDGVIRWNEGP